MAKLNMGNLGESLADIAGGKAAKGNIDLQIMLISLNEIIEDVQQPRQRDNDGFSDEAIEELAASIREIGILEPISVRSNPDKDPKYIINYGARRFLAAKKAGLKVIPAMLKEEQGKLEQLIENMHRRDLNYLEVADSLEIIKKEKNWTNTEIAKKIGRSPAFMTLIGRVKKLSDYSKSLLKSEKVTDQTLIFSVDQLYKKFPEEVEKWVSEVEAVTRGAFETFRQFLEGDSGKEGDEEGESAHPQDTQDSGNRATKNKNDEQESGKVVNRDPHTIDAFSGSADQEEKDDKPARPKGEAKELKNATVSRANEIYVLYEGDTYVLSLTESPDKRSEEGALRSKRGIIYQKDDYEKRRIVDISELKLIEINFN